ncbi:MAG: hypothetical protein EOP53_23300 [Sphingobacteriales bacterium]|nr:MAG: hypothetical protein EOP53_23300 [Sphingobacteriales bacterium]
MPQNIILWDCASHKALLPFTFTRPVALIRCGILTIAEKYGKLFSTEVSFLTQPHLQPKYKANIQQQNLVINAAVLPDDDFITACKNLAAGETLMQNDIFLAGNFNAEEVSHISHGEKMPSEIYPISGPLMEEKLRGRRDDLLDKGMKYYRYLAKSAIINGTNEEELFRISGNDDQLLVQVFAWKNNKVDHKIFERTFSEKHKRGFYGRH